MYYFWGMHGYWWVFWIFLWIMFFSFMMPVRRTTTGKCNRLYSSCKGDMPAVRSPAKNTKNGEPNSSGMPIRNRDISMDPPATILGIGRTFFEICSAVGERAMGREPNAQFDKGDIKASLKPHRLSVSGKSEFGEDHQSRRHNHSHGRAQLMFRVIDLPCGVDLSKAKATLNDNTLEVVMPRAAPVKSLRVETRPRSSSEGDSSAQETGRIEAAGNPRAVTGANEPMVEAKVASSKG